MNDEKKEIELTGEEVQKKVFEQLKQYENRSFLEIFALFMGKAQILEFGLKKILTSRYGYEEETLEKWTLGKVTTELEKKGLRGDYISLLNELVKYRNYCAHEILVGNGLLREFLGDETDRLSMKPLKHGIYQVEQAIIVFDFLEENDMWD